MVVVVVVVVVVVQWTGTYKMKRQKEDTMPPVSVRLSISLARSLRMNGTNPPTDGI